jgi:hypothetical protein
MVIWPDCDRCMLCVQQKLSSISDALRSGKLMVGRARPPSRQRPRGVQYAPCLEPRVPKKKHPQ